MIAEWEKRLGKKEKEEDEEEKKEEEQQQQQQQQQQQTTGTISWLPHHSVVEEADALLSTVTMTGKWHEVTWMLQCAGQVLSGVGKLMHVEGDEHHNFKLTSQFSD